MPEHVDQPEPRGQTIAAVLAVGGIYLALPRNVVDQRVLAFLFFRINQIRNLINSWALIV